MPISPARQAAFNILKKILQEDGFASDLLQADATRSFKDEDKRLLTELTLGVTRHCRLLDWILAPYSQKPLSKLDPDVLLALRLGVYQILFLTRIPLHAVVDESVALVKRARLVSASGFVNAVLRRINKEQDRARIDTLDKNSCGELSIRYSHPEWIVKRWIQRYGMTLTQRLLEHNNFPPRMFFRMNSPRVLRSRLLEELQKEGIAVRPHPLSSDILEVSEGELFKTKSVREHDIYIQDAGSQLVARLLSLTPGDCCLDLCAGVGGKSSQLAQFQVEGSSIYATDLQWNRLSLGKQWHGNNWPRLQWIAADATQPLPFRILFDKILVDAPCSGTGTLQRHPEIRWRLQPSQLSLFQDLQMTLLANAISYLKPTGSLVYSTCSLEPEENEDVLESFLSKYPDYGIAPPGDPLFQPYVTKTGILKLIPPITNTDGFCAAIIQKKTLTK